jgi:hypothetical protein
MMALPINSTRKIEKMANSELITVFSCRANNPKPFSLENSPVIKITQTKIKMNANEITVVWAAFGP